MKLVNIMAKAGKSIINHKGVLIGIGLMATAGEVARRMIANRRALKAKLAGKSEKKAMPFPKERNKREIYHAPQIPPANLARH